MNVTAPSKTRRLMAFTAIALGVAACLNSPEKRPSNRIPDFSLGSSDAALDPKPTGPKGPLRANDGASLVKTSLPIAVRVGKGRDSFDQIPRLAQAPAPVFQVRKIDNCLIGVRSDVFLVNRYLAVKEDVIKMDDGLSARDLLRLDVGQDLFLSLSAALRPHMLKREGAACAKSLKGKKTYLGKAHFQKAQVGLVNAPGSPMANMVAVPPKATSVKVFIQWKETDQAPEVVDETGIPVTLESPIHKATLKKDGFYYVAVLPNLQIQP